MEDERRRTDRRKERGGMEAGRKTGWVMGERRRRRLEIKRIDRWEEP